MDENIVKGDLHTHTTASDGLLSPIELMQLAERLQLKYFAITDHDTMDGVIEVQQNLHNFHGTFIPGVEINVEGINSRKMEILAYNIDPHSVELQNLFKKMEESRLVRGKQMIEKLQKLNIDIKWADLLKIKSKGIIGRPHIARALVKLGVCNSVQDAFSRYVGIGKPAYVSRYKLHPKQIIPLIHQSGGIAIWAHPLITSYHPEEIRAIFSKLSSYGLDGIELYYDYSRFLKSESISNADYKLALTQLKEISNSPEIYITGGSDWHGTDPCKLGSISLPAFRYLKLCSKSLS